VMTVEFELDGQAFTALNGGPVFRFNEAVSFQVVCGTQGRWTSIGTGSPRAATRRRSSAAG
jgi:predicted 3-demethylubiquinone-9 3-methyltransferase (glyoxalase superfamily)